MGSRVRGLGMIESGWMDLGWWSLRMVGVRVRVLGSRVDGSGWWCFLGIRVGRSGWWGEGA